MSKVKEIQEARDVLKQAGYFTQNLWHIADVIEKAKEEGYKLTDEQAKEILELMGRRHDAGFGVNWDFIEACIHEYFEK